MIVLAALFCVARVAFEEELAPLRRRLEERRAARRARAALRGKARTRRRLILAGTVHRAW